MNVLINGISGFMGREVAKLCKNGYRGSTLYAGTDPNAKGDECELIYKSFNEIENSDSIDCIVDFSHHTVTPSLLEFAVSRNLPLVLATTGHSDDEIREIHAAARKIPLFYSGNMSLGIALLIELAKKTAEAMPEAEIEIAPSMRSRWRRVL